MGSIRDELYDSMWDTVACKKHNWIGPDSRFSCPKCEVERKQTKELRRTEAKKILEEHGLEGLI